MSSVWILCVFFFYQCTKLDWSFVESLVSFFCKITPSYILVSSVSNGPRTIKWKKKNCSKFLTFNGVFFISVWTDILICFHILYCQSFERLSKIEKKRDLQTQTIYSNTMQNMLKTSQSNVFFSLLICPFGLSLHYSFLIFSIHISTNQ